MLKVSIKRIDDLSKVQLIQVVSAKVVVVSTEVVSGEVVIACYSLQTRPSPKRVILLGKRVLLASCCYNFLQICIYYIVDIE